MRYHAVNTAIMQPCYLATSFIRGGGQGGQSSHGGAMAPLATPKNRPCAAQRVIALTSCRSTCMFIIVADKSFVVNEILIKI